MRSETYSRFGSLVLGALIAASLAGCGEDTTPGDTAAPAAEIEGLVEVPESADHNTADVVFASLMVPHHAQALSMVDLTRGRRGLSPDVVALSEQIQATQAPEIQQMVTWLSDWDQPIPETQRDHLNAEGHGGDEDGNAAHHDLPGMVSEEEMTALADEPKAMFEQRWLELMIEHHEGAIEMASDELEQGEDADVKDLAQSIIDGQQAEIDQMKRLIDG